MGKLTEDMTRLRNEIEAMRQGRKTLLKEMVRGAKVMKGAVAKMQAGFRQGHARMAKESRGSRLRFLHDLNTGVARMQVGFRQAHTQMARETKRERLAFISDLKNTVSLLQGGFHHARTQIGQRDRAARRRFVAHLEELVGGLRREFAADLAGAHRAFFSLSVVEPKPRVEAQRRAREATLLAERQAEAEPRGKEEKKGGQSEKSKTP